MLENIKSSFFIKNLFFSLYDKTLLKLIKYSTKWQKYINISLINYIIFSGKYILYETKAEGKIYNALNDILLYEGGIKDGKKNGKGKEYNEYGTIMYEGEYSNGKRNGKGKEYDQYGLLIFEGEYYNGKLWNGKINNYDLKMAI